MTKELKEQIHERIYNLKVPTLGFSRQDLFNIAMEYAEPREKRIAELEAQIDKMKCCGNCRFSESDKLNGTFCHREGCYVVTIAERQLDILKLKGENAELNFKLKQAVKILKECAEYEDLTCYSDILEEIETFLKKC